MARDYGDVHDIDSLPDDELRALLLERIGEGAGTALDGLSVHVVDGSVHLEGRVGTEGELRQIEHIVTDVLGVRDLTSGVVVDELARQQQPDSADDAAAAAAEAEPMLGEGGERTSDEAAHLEESARDLHGTRDPAEAVERGFSYTPPEAPLQEGGAEEER
jgi:hypothetical protein